MLLPTGPVRRWLSDGADSPLPRKGLIMSDYEGGGPAPYGGSASAPIGAPTPEPGDEWQAVVDADDDAEKAEAKAKKKAAKKRVD